MIVNEIYIYNGNLRVELAHLARKGETSSPPSKKFTHFSTEQAYSGIAAKRQLLAHAQNIDSQANTH